MRAWTVIAPLCLLLLVGCEPAADEEAALDPSLLGKKKKGKTVKFPELHAKAEAGDVKAMVALAHKLAEVGDLADASGFYVKAAEKGHEGAMFTVGNMHLTRELGDKSDDAIAKRWLGQLADGGDEDAQTLVASLLTPEELKERRELWREVAEEKAKPKAHAGANRGVGGKFPCKFCEKIFLKPRDREENVCGECLPKLDAKGKLPVRRGGGKRGKGGAKKGKNGKPKKKRTPPKRVNCARCKKPGHIRSRWFTQCPRPQCVGKDQRRRAKKNIGTCVQCGKTFDSRGNKTNLCKPHLERIKSEQATWRKEQKQQRELKKQRTCVRCKEDSGAVLSERNKVCTAPECVEKERERREKGRARCATCGSGYFWDGPKSGEFCRRHSK